MVDQVLHFARELRDLGRAVTNVVFMGMGEPFLNYDETLRACRLLCDPEGFGLGARGVSISTAGVEPAVRRFTAEESQINLAVSLHAAHRRAARPARAAQPALPARHAASRRAPTTWRAAAASCFFEYVVLAGVNDGDDQVRALAGRLGHPLYHLNLIAYNETGGEFARPEARELAALYERLTAAGVTCTVRRSPGGEIEAACGQLALARVRGPAIWPAPRAARAPRAPPIALVAAATAR